MKEVVKPKLLSQSECTGLDPSLVTIIDEIWSEQNSSNIDKSKALLLIN